MNLRVWCGVAAAAALFLVRSGPLAAQDQEPKKVESYTFRPAKREFTQDHLKHLKVPSGFRISVFAEGLGNARMMRLGPDGQIFLTRFKEGDVLELRDRDRDGRMDEKKTVARIPKVHGIVLHERTMYLASDSKMFKASLKEDGSLEKPVEFATLPDGGQHPRRTLGIGPDGLLYVSIGSTCNNCEESNPEHATMLRMQLDGSRRAIFAKGLRNTIGFDWHPVTRGLWGFDHGSDERGNDIPPEELNLIKEGADYGWPYCYGDKTVDPFAKPPSDGTKEERCAQSEGAVLHYQAHAAPIEFVFYKGAQFPQEFQGDGFVAFHGSWNRMPAAGYSVGRVRFENGRPEKIEEFVTGFLIEDGRAQFGRPAGLVVAADGALLISDDENGTIYRVAAADR